MSADRHVERGGTTASGPPAISLRGLSRRMGGDVVLSGIDLDVAPGRVVVLRGSNGAGKTTLLKVLATRLRPSSGAGAVFGHDLVAGAGEVRATVGFLGVYGGNYPMLTARENLSLAASLASGGAAAVPRAAAIDAALALVGLPGSDRKLVRSFSSGMKKRLGLARMVVLDPRLWLLDEPYAALDDEAKSLVDRLIEEARLRGKTVLLASHESDRRELRADAVLRLGGGRLHVVETEATAPQRPGPAGPEAAPA